MFSLVILTPIQVPTANSRKFSFFPEYTVYERGTIAFPHTKTYRNSENKIFSQKRNPPASDSKIHPPRINLFSTLQKNKSIKLGFQFFPFFTRIILGSRRGIPASHVYPPQLWIFLLQMRFFREIREPAAAKKDCFSTPVGGGGK